MTERDKIAQDAAIYGIGIGMQSCEGIQHLPIERMIMVTNDRPLDRLVDAARAIDKCFESYAQVSACWGCDMNFSKHDKHDDDCPIQELHLALAAFERTAGKDRTTDNLSGEREE